MSRLPPGSYRMLEAVLLWLGFHTVRQRGSHVCFRHPDGRTTTTVPTHPGRDLARPLRREILRAIARYNRLCSWASLTLAPGGPHGQCTAVHSHADTPHRPPSAA